MQPGSFTPSVGARTRYGILSNPWDAKNFYHFMAVKTQGTTYSWGDKRSFIADPSPIQLKPVPNDYTKTVEPNNVNYDALSVGG